MHKINRLPIYRILSADSIQTISWSRSLGIWLLAGMVFCLGCQSWPSLHSDSSNRKNRLTNTYGKDANNLNNPSSAKGWNQQLGNQPIIGNNNNTTNSGADGTSPLDSNSPNGGSLNGGSLNGSSQDNNSQSNNSQSNNSQNNNSPSSNNSNNPSSNPRKIKPEELQKIFPKLPSTDENSPIPPSPTTNTGSNTKTSSSGSNTDLSTALSKERNSALTPKSLQSSETLVALGKSSSVTSGQGENTTAKNSTAKNTNRNESKKDSDWEMNLTSIKIPPFPSIPEDNKQNQLVSKLPELARPQRIHVVNESLSKTKDLSADLQGQPKFREGSGSNLYSADSLRRIYSLGLKAYEKINTFEARLIRQEAIKNKLQPLEIIHYHFRKSPFSVHMKWTGKEATGREVLYVEGENDNKIEILLARSDPKAIFMRHISLSPDSSLVRSQSRHDIREAGMWASLYRLAQLIQIKERDPANTRVIYRGLEKRKEYPQPMECVQENIPSGIETDLPRGGKRLTYYATELNTPAFGLPVLVITFDERNALVEYYCFDRLNTLTPFDKHDFDVNRLKNAK